MTIGQGSSVRALVAGGSPSGLFTNLQGVGGPLINTVSITGTLPAFTTPPTFNLGTLNGAATAANQTAVQSAPGTSATTANGMQGVTNGVPLGVSQQDATPVTVTPATASGNVLSPPIPRAMRRSDFSSPAHGREQYRSCRATIM